ACDEREICPANARSLGGSDRGQERQTRVCADAGDARAAHPARESDFEYLYQPGAGLADGEHLHDRVRQNRRTLPTSSANMPRYCLPARHDSTSSWSRPAKILTPSTRGCWDTKSSAVSR